MVSMIKHLNIFHNLALIFNFFWLGWVLVVTHRIFHCGAQTPEIMGFVAGTVGLVGEQELSCPMVCRIRVPQPGIQFTPPALADRFLTTRPPGKSQASFKIFNNVQGRHCPPTSCMRSTGVTGCQG